MINNSLIFRGRGILRELFAKGIPYHRNEKVNPFFIVGSGRCGTTLLRRILHAGSNIYIPPENWALSKLLYKFRRLRTQMNWDTLVDLTVAVHCQDTQDWFDQFPKPFVYEMRQLPEAERSVNRLIDSIYHYYAEINDIQCERWGDKTPLNVRSMSLTLCAFPDARFVHLIRDGVDVVHSLQKVKTEKTLTELALWWQQAIDKGTSFRKKHPEKILEVRYEDLVRDPASTVKRICEFLDITFDERILHLQEKAIPDDLTKQSHYQNTLKPITDEHIGKGRRNLTNEKKRVLKKVINTDLKRLGYDPL